MRVVFLKSLRTLAVASRAFLCALLFTASAGIFPAENRAQEQKKRPNLLLITIDTVRADHLGCYGYKGGTSPNLDALAAGGVLFTEAHAHVPLTLPSHANILTGRLPSTLNLRVNGLRMKSGTPNLALALKKKGYTTSAVVSSVIIDRNRGLAEGFDFYDDAMNLGPKGGGGSLGEKRAEETTRVALAESKKFTQGPFFLWVHYYDPHTEYIPPEPYKEKFAKVPYDGEIAYMDAQIGALLGGMEKAGLMENTIVAIAADHGESLEEFGESEHGVFIYEPVMHVPLIFAWKGHIPEGKRVAGLCGLVDIAPTLCELMGLPPVGTDGSSLVQSTSSGRVNPERSLYIESYHGYFGYGWAPLRGIMDGKYKFIQAPKPELYEWHVSEKNNLIQGLPSERMRLSELLARYPEADKGEKDQMERLLSDPSNQETLKQLLSLGYLSGRGQNPDNKGLLDPKDVISFEDDLMRARDLLEGYKVKEGIDLLLGLLKVNPTNIQALSMLGKAYLGMKDLAKAKVCFDEILKLRPQMENAHVSLGAIYETQGEIDLAIREYRAALTVNPRLPEAITSLSQVLINQKKYAEAESILDDAVIEGVGSSEIYFKLGNALAAQAKWERAKWAFTKSISMDPRKCQAMATLGNIAAKEGKVDEAISIYERALRIEAKNPYYLEAVGSLYLNGKRDPKKALPYYQRALDASPYGQNAARLKKIIAELKAESGR